MSPRIRRLKSDNEKLRRSFSSWHLISIEDEEGIPPVKYHISYNVKGLYKDSSGEILERERHVLEIDLSLGYPKRSPQCRMLTPVFHPNFDDASVCIGDHWAAAEGLDDLVIRVGRMIAYQEYNVKSPLNAIAQKWAEENIPLFPVDSREIAPPAEGENSPTSGPISVDLDRSEAPPAPEDSNTAPDDDIVIQIGKDTAELPLPPASPPKLSEEMSEGNQDFHELEKKARKLEEENARLRVELDEAETQLRDTVAQPYGPTLYHLFRDEEAQSGPLSLAELVLLVGKGEWTLDDHAWTDGMEDWTPLGQLLKQNLHEH